MANDRDHLYTTMMEAPVENVVAGGEGLIISDLISNSNVNDEKSTNEFCEEKQSQEVLECPEGLQAFIQALIGPIGLEVHPFLIGWYNEKVGPKFQLDYPKDTLAFVVISGPDMFEKCIVPYVKLRLVEDPEFFTNEPLDDSMKHAFTILKEDFKSEGVEVDVFHDFDLYPSRRPKVLVQTAAHVAGAVQYLHKNILPEDIQEQRFSKKSNLSGVAIHPKYGGWYAIRGVVIFTNVPHAGKCLKRPEPLQIFNNHEVIAHAIELFAYNWQTNEWRDIHPSVGGKYSQNFLKYLDLETSERWSFLKNILQMGDDVEDGVHGNLYVS